MSVVLYKLFLSKFLISRPINVRAREQTGLDAEKKFALNHLHHLHSLPLVALHHPRQDCGSRFSQADFIEAFSLIEPMQGAEALLDERVGGSHPRSATNHARLWGAIAREP
jgi:hypothetical protein